MTAVRDPDAPLLRSVRWRLILWSGGSTLVLLAILGGILYWAVAERLRTESVAQLVARAELLQIPPAITTPAGVSGAIPVTVDPANLGLILGGPLSGTIAFAVPVDGVSVPPGQDGSTGSSGPLPSGIPLALPPDPVAIEAALAGRRTISERDLGSLPVRVMTTAITAGGKQVAVQVVVDRSAEIQTLRTLLLVLVVGGLAAVLAAAAIGYLYAGRALVPIQASLRRQREFAADASHELRTPLAIVGASIEHLRRGRGDPAAVDQAIADLEAGTGRLNSLVDDLLLLARADADVVELAQVPLELGEVTADALDGFASLAAARGVRLRLDIEPAPVVGDEARLRQLVGILVDNAIRHTPPGSAVTVRVRAGATLEVDDEGPGIAEADLHNVFERFWRAPASPSGGTGLGLSIAEWIASSHRGQIRAINRPEGGARFRVTLPGVGRP